MIKRLLSIFLSLCMILTMLPLSVMAQETSTNNGEIGEISAFEPLEETEITATIGTFIEDLDLPKTLIVTVVQLDTNQQTVTEEVYSSAYEDVQIDIPVTWASQPEYDMDTEGEYIFTPVIEGYDVNTELPEIIVTVATAILGRGLLAPLELDTYNIWVGGVQVTSDNESNVLGDEGGTVTYTPATGNTAQTLTLNGANIANSYSWDNKVAGIYALGDLNIILNGENSITAANNDNGYSSGIHFDGTPGILATLTISGDGSLHTKGGDISKNINFQSSGIYGQNIIIDSGTVVAESGITTGYALGIGIASNAYITINGGNVTAIGNASGYQSNGIRTHSSTINGGTITARAGDADYSFGIYCQNDLIIKGGNLSVQAGNADTLSYGINLNVNSLIVSGGGIIARGNTKGIGASQYNPRELSFSNVTISGGEDEDTLSPITDPESFRSEAYKYVKIEPAPASTDVAKNTDTDTSYETLQAAVDAIEDGQTIQLLRNINLTTTVIIANNNNKSFTMDLNGKILDGGSNPAITHKGTGELTIQGNGTVKSSGSSSFDGAISNKSTGSIIIFGGIVQGNGAGIFNLEKGTITISGGSISGRIGIFNNSGGIVNISGGTVQSTGNDGNAIYTNEGGNITISGNAHITSANNKTDDATISLWFSNDLRPITFTINGGTIENTAGVNAISKRGNSNGKLIANVSIPNGKSAFIKGGGHAMNFAPTLVRATVTVSENISGTPVVDYSASDIKKYKYLNFEPGPDATITNLNLTNKLTAPATGGMPTTAITDDQYTGTIEWSGNPMIFSGGKAYTSIVTLTALDGYTFSGVTHNAFSHAGATSVANSAGSSQTMTITITFPQTVEKTTQVISYADITVAKTYGDTKFVNPLNQDDINGTITYISDDTAVATVDPSTGEVTIVSVGDGSATITATAVETATHAGATASYTVTVSKKALTLKADDKNMIQGDELPNFTFTAIGLVNGDNVIAPPTISTTTNGATVGNFDITPSGGVVENDASYNIIYTKGTLKVAGGSGGSGSSSGGSGSSGGSPSNDNSSLVIVTPPAADKPNDPTQGEIKVLGTADGKGNITVNITNKTVTDAFDKALADAKKNGNEQNGITVVLHVDTSSKNSSNITVNLPKTVQDTIIAKKIVNTIVVVDNPDIRIGMDLATVQEINNQAKSDVNITATRRDSDKLTDDGKKAIGSRPVFDLNVNYGSSKQVQNFGVGNVSVTIPYTLGANEKAGNVQAVYLDDNGKVHWLVNSVYDSMEKVLRFSTNHFSTYGVGYKEDAPAFTDIESHWAKEDIEFVISNGLFSGTSVTTFSPNTAMTRGMFVTVLGRLVDADVSSYNKSNFTDVKIDAYYMNYIEWASKNSIVNGIGNGKFAPDQSITREQMAAIIRNYAKIMDIKLTQAHEENIFCDSTKISAYAKEAVKEMQMAGVISGKNSNLFDPQGTATRAEIAAVLRRFGELRRSSDTM